MMFAIASVVPTFFEWISPLLTGAVVDFLLTFLPLIIISAQVSKNFSLFLRKKNGSEWLDSEPFREDLLWD